MKSRDAGENISKTIEDYLLYVYTLASDGRTVIAARLAEALDVAPPTVTATLHRMSRDGLISVNPNREIELTEMGLTLAETMVRRHRLAERFLTDVLGLGWAEVHEQAHGLEHAITARIEERIMAVLGNPKTCPHGSPIPGTGATIARDAVRLDGVDMGKHVVIERIAEDAEDNRELMDYFERYRLFPAHEFDVDEIEGNELIVLRQGERSIPLGMIAAHSVWVRVMDAREPAPVAP